MAYVDLSPLANIDGFIGACMVDTLSGLVLGADSIGFDLDTAAAGTTEVIRSQRLTLKSLGLDDEIEDILVSLGSQYHLIRPLETNDTLFIYLVLERSQASLGLARAALKQFEKRLKFSL